MTNLIDIPDKRLPAPLDPHLLVLPDPYAVHILAWDNNPFPCLSRYISLPIFLYECEVRIGVWLLLLGIRISPRGRCIIDSRCS
jgi:hypothetical protein